MSMFHVHVHGLHEGGKRGGGEPGAGMDGHACGVTCSSRHWASPSISSPALKTGAEGETPDSPRSCSCAARNPVAAATVFPGRSTAAIGLRACSPTRARSASWPTSPNTRPSASIHTTLATRGSNSGR